MNLREHWIPFLRASCSLSCLRALFPIALLFAISTESDVAVAAPTNILFCIADDASPHFGVYGCDWVKTPNIDELGKRGLVFENVYTPTAKCAPSRAAILTGRNPWQLEEAANHMCYFPSKFKSFSEALQESGLAVGAHGKVWGPGVANLANDNPRNWGMDHATGKDIEASFRQFLASRKSEQPFFYWYGSANPHRAYELDSGIAAGKKISDIDHVPACWPDNDTVRRDMLDYAIEVEAFDKEVGQLVKVLKESGEMANTLVIVTSDHGMPFPRSKGHTYEISNHVPFVASWPRGIDKPGTRVKDLISFIDLAPSFLEILGVSEASSGMAAMTGQSIQDLLRGKPEKKRERALVGRERNDWGRPELQSYPVRGIVQDKFLLLLNLKPDRWPCCNPETYYPDTDPSPTKTLIGDAREDEKLKSFWQLSFGIRPAEEFYDLTADPDCVTNLADTPAVQPRKEMMKKQLLDQLAEQKDPRIVGDGDQFDRYLPTRKEWIGKFERGETDAPGNEKANNAAKAKR